jgi:hypothetical protein
MMRELREEGLVMFRSYKVEILDRQRLVEIAEYDGQFMRMSVFDKSI